MMVMMVTLVMVMVVMVVKMMIVNRELIKCKRYEKFAVFCNLILPAVTLG